MISKLLALKIGLLGPASKQAAMRFKTAGVIVTLVLVMLVVASPSGAQQVGRVSRIGFLGAVTPEDFPHLEAAFREGLREFGYVEGQNLLIEYRWAEGQAERLPELAADLAQLKVEAIFCITSAAARAAKNATSTIPIVFVGVSDPVRYGFVASLTQPGGNMTGLGHFTPELNGKRLELLKEVRPQLTRVAVLWNTGNESHEEQIRDLAGPAQALGLQLRAVGVQKSEELEGAFQAMAKEQAEALMVLASSLTHRHLTRIADLAMKHRLPSIMEFSEFADAGGLIMYGPTWADMFRRGGNLLGKILNGAKPTDLPVEQPTRFALLINLKTAKAIGMAIPQSVLFRADRMIE
jgi:putative ABC transport system substrate-binding protein